MKEIFPIMLYDERYHARQLSTFEDSIVYEIWYRGELQFIVSYAFDEHNVPVWTAGALENCNMSEDLLYQIGIEIISFYKKLP